MENENLNTSAELEQMRKEYDLLKNKFAQQSIVNDRLLKESMKRKLTWLDKEEREEYIYAGVAIALGVVFGVVWRKVKRGANKALGRDENAGKEVEDEIVRR